MSGGGCHVCPLGHALMDPKRKATLVPVQSYLAFLMAPSIVPEERRGSSVTKG